MESTDEQIKRLNHAKALAEEDNSLYPQIVQVVTSLIQKQDTVLRKWCCDFLVSAFSNESVDIEVKKALAVLCSEPILKLLSSAPLDLDITKSMITIACSIYPLIFSFVARNPQPEVWQTVIDIKSRILSLWGASNCLGTFIVATKFAQQVILVQSYGIRDPRIASPNDFSLVKIPSSHPFLDRTLEAEGLGLLDRLLSMLQNEVINAPKLTCVLSTLAPLIRNRPALVQRIVSALLTFDSSAKTTTQTTAACAEMEYKFVERQIKLLLHGIVLKGNLAPNLAPQIHSFLSSMSQGRASERLKRRLVQSQDTPDQRLQKPLTNQPIAPLKLPPGPASYTALFNLQGENNPLANFDVRELGPEIATNIAIASLATVSLSDLEKAVSVVTRRYQDLMERGATDTNEQVSADQMPLDQYDQDNDESDYEPDFGKAFATSPTATSSTNTSTPTTKSDTNSAPPASTSPASITENNLPGEIEVKLSDESIKTEETSFALPEPKPLTSSERLLELEKVMDRLRNYCEQSSNEIGGVAPSVSEAANAGICRVAFSRLSSTTWVTLVSRVITRGPAHDSASANLLRQRLYDYIMADFRSNWEVIILWLNEEWLADRTKSTQQQAFTEWSGKIFNNIIPFLEVSDSKGFLRLLSDLPEIHPDVFTHLKSLCIDPDRSQVGIRALKWVTDWFFPCGPQLTDF